MVVAVEARKLGLSLLSPSLSSSSAAPISLFFDPDSLTLALMLSDSSISLHFPFSAFSLPSSSSNLPPRRTVIPPASSSACFLRLVSRPPNPNTSLPSTTLFVSAGPASEGDSKILLRFFVKLKEGGGEFVRASVSCRQNGLNSDRGSGGVVVDGSHGTKVLLVGTMNYFAMYSASASKVWVFGLNQSGGGSREGNVVGLKLVKTAVIDYKVQVSSISVSAGILIIGELNGVRVFPLHRLAKGRAVAQKKGKVAGIENGKLEALVHKKSKGESLDLKLANGVAKGRERNFDSDDVVVDLAKLKLIGNVGGKAKNLTNGRLLVTLVDASRGSSEMKQKSLKLSQDAGESGACFVPFSDSEAGILSSTGSSDLSMKAVSIHAFSQHKFLVLDSNGHVHILHASTSRSSTMKRVAGISKVQQLAILPDMSESSQIVWLLDGSHSLQTIALTDADSSINDSDFIDSGGVHVSGIQVIFTNESVQDTLPLSANAILILGQDNLYAYAIS